ncbi:MAG: PKD domain-containing protein, partial [Candidatus Altiarchaeales archaeon]|nr:PKD domain-containing protein [Candidatus Altiarchaeales archaeon]
MKNKILISIIVLTASIVSAQDVSNLGNFINRLLCFAFMIMPAVVTILIILGGILVLTGDSAKRKQGKAVVINAIIGLIILFIVAWLVTLTTAELDLGDFIQCFGGGPPPEYPTSTTIPANEPPIAIARGGLTASPLPNLTEVYAAPSTPIYFYGGDSIDPDGNIMEYHWEFGDGASDDGKLVNHIYTTGGTYNAQLRVMDDDFAYSMSTVKVIIQPLEAHILKPGDGVKFIRPGGRVDFEGEGKYGVPHPTAPYYSYRWTSSKNGILSTNKSFRMDAIQLDFGPHIINLTVTDSTGATASDVVTIRIVPPKELQAKITNPTNDDCFPLALGGTITFDGRGVDGVPCLPPDPPYNYSWTSGGVVLSTNKSFTLDVADLGSGDHTIILIVTDCSGATASDRIVIHIPEPPIAEIINPLNDGETLDCTDKLKGKASKGLPPYNVKWKAGGSVFATGTIAADGGTHQTGKRPSPPGIYDITFEIKDKCGQVDSDSKRNIDVIACSPCDTYHQTGVLPDKFDWSHVILPGAPPLDGKNWMSSVKHQGSCGSCWAFSVVGAVEGTYNVEQNDPNLDRNLAEENLVTNCGCSGACNGGWPHIGLSYVKSPGIVDENCFHYQDASGCPISCAGCDEMPTVCSNALCSDRCGDWNTKLWKIGGYSKVSSNRDAIKEALICHGPLSVGSMNWGHAIVLVGYSEPGGYWIIKNSHGLGYGTNGYGKIGYGSVYGDLVNYAYYIEGVKPPS